MGDGVERVAIPPADGRADDAARREVAHEEVAHRRAHVVVAKLDDCGPSHVGMTTSEPQHEGAPGVRGADGLRACASRASQ